MQKHTLSNVKWSKTEVAAQLQERVPQLIAEHSQAHPPQQLAGIDSLPIHLRTSARICLLGWDAAEDVIKQRAQQTLEQAGVDPASFFDLRPSRREGSTADVAFRSLHELSVAKDKLRGLAKTWAPCTNACWLDVMKTRKGTTAEQNSSSVARGHELARSTNARPSETNKGPSKAASETRTPDPCEFGGRQTSLDRNASVRFDRETLQECNGWAISARLAMEHIQTVAINAGRNLRLDTAKDALLDSCYSLAPLWRCCFVAEVGNRPVGPSTRQAISLLDDHLWFHHHPGEGGTVVALAIHKRARFWLREVTWRNRTVRVSFRVHTPGARALRLTLVAGHCPHDDGAFRDWLWDIRAQWCSRPRISKCLTRGDINIDQLPMHPHDPFKSYPAREECHKDRRRLLSSLLAACQATLVLPTPGLGRCPLSPWPPEAPCTRIPLDDQQQLPSLIDYAWTSEDFFASFETHWTDAPADHSWIVATTKDMREVAIRKAPRTWQCCDPQACSEHLQNIDFSSARTSQDLETILKEVQAAWRDGNTCAERSKLREPTDSKELITKRRATYCSVMQAALRTRL